MCFSAQADAVVGLALLPVGTRLAIGDEAVLEISGPANPCDVIKGAFNGGKSGRISILLHPTDSRMYARVLATGEVRPGDAIRVLAPLPGSDAGVHKELDLLDMVEREAWLAMWRAAWVSERLLSWNRRSRIKCKPSAPRTNVSWDRISRIFQDLQDTSCES